MAGPVNFYTSTITPYNFAVACHNYFLSNLFTFTQKIVDDICTTEKKMQIYKFVLNRRTNICSNKIFSVASQSRQYPAFACGSS